MKGYELFSMVVSIYAFIGYTLYQLPLRAFALGWIVGYVLANSFRELRKKKIPLNKLKGDDLYGRNFRKDS